MNGYIQNPDIPRLFTMVLYWYQSPCLARFNSVRYRTLCNTRPEAGAHNFTGRDSSASDFDPFCIPKLSLISDASSCDFDPLSISKLFLISCKDASPSPTLTNAPTSSRTILYKKRSPCIVIWIRWPPVPRLTTSMRWIVQVVSTWMKAKKKENE